MNPDLKSFLQVVKEFMRALAQKRTYNIFKNSYCFFGILWGIPIPIVTIGIDLYSRGLNPGISNLLHLIAVHPFHLLFLLHPLFFGVVFGAMGTVRHSKEQKIEEFENNLIDKNIELERMNKKLQHLDKLKSNFLSIVSHELRTPLTTIQGYISFLRGAKTGPLNARQEECLRISDETADTLNRLIEELLDLSKIEMGEFKVNLASVNMQEVIEKAITSLRLLADSQGITLENNLPPGLPLIRADKERILQVVTNLLENAVKFNQRNGRVSISTIAPSPDSRVTFCIQDTGIGIPEEMLDKIFDKFYQADSSGKRKYSGCGLGLAITKSIIQLHQGRIWVESKVGAGSRFFFELNSC